MRSGSGTSGDPWIIENWEINSSSSVIAINIQDTNMYVQINYIQVTGDQSGQGIRLKNATHVSINHLLIENVSAGITILPSCSDVALNNVTISSVGTALRIDAAGVQGTGINATSSAGIGIDITGATVAIDNSDVHHCAGNGLNSVASGTIVNNSRFFNNTGDAIYLTGSSYKIMKTNLTWNFAYGVRMLGANGLVRDIIAKFTALEHLFLEGSGASYNNVSFNTLLNSTGRPAIRVLNAPDNLVNNNTITNLIGASPAADGIIITGGTGLRNNVINNTFSVNQTGVAITSGAGQNKVQRNKFTRASVCVAVTGSDANDIMSNLVTANNSVALRVMTSTGVKYTGNTVSEVGATTSILIDNQNSPNTIIGDNQLVGGATAVEVFGSTGVQVLRNRISGFSACGVHAAPGTTNLNISLNTIFQASTGTGVWIETSGNVVARNNITAMNNGIDISDPVMLKTGNVIRRNFIENNIGTGLILDANTSSNAVYDNVFNNPAGVNVQCGNNTNTFVSLTMGTRNILNGPNVGGNYWHTYVASNDSNLDGFGDVPYTQLNVLDPNPLVVLPVVNSPGDTDFYSGLANCRIPWIISASRPVVNRNYVVLIDGVTYATGTWDNGTQVIVDVDTSLPAGVVYNYTIKYDHSGGLQQGRPDSVFVYVRAATTLQTFAVTTSNQTSRFASLGLTLSVQGNKTMDLYLDRNNNTADLLYQIPGTPGNAQGLNVRVVHNQLTGFKLNYSIAIEYTDAQLSALGIDDARIDPYLWNDGTRQWVDLRAVAKSYSIDRSLNIIRITMPENTSITGEFIFIGTPALSVTTNSTYYTNTQSVQISITWAGVRDAALSLEIKTSGSTTLYSNTSWGITDAAGTHVGTIKISGVGGLDNGNFSIHVSASNGTHEKTNQYYLRYFVVDSTLPAITIVTPANGTTFNAAPTFIVNVFDVNFASATYQVNSLSIRPFTCNSSVQIDLGDWNTLGNGTHTVQIRSTDLAGNAHTRAFTFVKDTGLTFMTIVSPANNSQYNAVFGFRVDVFDLYYSNVTYQIDSLAVRLFSRNTTVLIDVGDWGSLGEGSHVITFVAKDTAGNSKTMSLAFVKDTVLPTVLITAPASGAAFHSPFTIGTRLLDFNPDLTSMSYRIDSPLNTSYSFSGNGSIDAGVFAGMAQGSHVLYVYGRDRAGNTNSASVPFIKDTVSPVVTISSPAPAKHFNATFTVTGINTDAYADDMWYTVNASGITGLMAFGGASWSAVIPAVSFNGLPDGVYNLTVFGNDTAGNTNKAWVLFTKDTVIPGLTLTINGLPPANNSYFNAAFTIGATVVDTNYDKTWYGVDGGSANFFEISTVIGGFASLSEGAHVLRVFASDKAGNVRVIRVDFFKDTGLPVVVINAPATGSYFNQTFLIDVTSTDANLASQWYVVDDVVATKRLFDGSETMVPAIFNSLTEGLHTVKVYANDSAGNMAFASFTFTKDTVLPVLVRVLPVFNPAGYYFRSTFNYHVNVTERNRDSAFYRIDSVSGPTTAFAENVSLAFTDFATLSEGSHTLYFYAIDLAGNVQTISFSFTKDTIKPTMVLASPANGTAFNSPFNYVVNVYDVNYANTTSRVDALATRLYSRNTSTTIDTSDWSLAGDGTHQVTFTALDLAGNTQVLILSFVKDTTAPTITLLQPTNNSYQAAAFMLGVRAQDPRFSRVWYRVDSGSLVYAYNGNETILGFSGLTEGSHRVQLFANDTLGNSRFIYVDFIKDTILPSVSVPSPSNNSQFRAVFSFLANVFDVNFDASTYRVDSGTVRAFTRNSTTSVDAGDWGLLTQGAHQVVIQVTDRAGNLRVVTINFIKDTIAPTLTIPMPGNYSYFRAAFDFSAFVYDVNYNNLTYQVDTSNIRTFSRNTTTLINTGDSWVNYQGSHTLRITAADVAGNIRTGTVIFTWDTAKPDITLVSPANGTYFNAAFTITTTITDTYLHSKWYNVDGGSNTTFTAGITLSFTGLSQGLHDVRVFANDSAGNVAWITYRFTKDTIVPVINILSPGQGQTFNAAFAMGTQVVDSYYNNMYYRIDSFTNGTYTFSGNDTINAAAFNAISQGSHAVHFYATDLAGNVNNLTLNFFKDTIAPVVTIASPANETAFNAVFSFRVNVFDVNFNSLTYRVNLLTVRSFSRNTSTPIDAGDWAALGQGVHDITVTATDLPGNSKVVHLAFTKDTIGPSVTFNQATNQTPCLNGMTYFVEKGDNVTIKVRVSDTYSGISRVQVFVNITGVPVASTMANMGGGVFQHVILGAAYQGITVAYYFRTNDTLNNVETSSTYTYFIVYDKETPVVAVNNAVQYTSSIQVNTAKNQTFQTTLRNYNTTSPMSVIYAVQVVRPDGVVMNLVYDASVVVAAGGTTIATLNVALPVGVTGTYTCTVQLKTGWIAAGGYTTWVKTVTFTATP